MSLAPSRWLETAATLARTYGTYGLALRAAHEARRFGGWFRATPSYSVGAVDSRPLFTLDSVRLRKADADGKGLARSIGVLNGTYDAFRAGWVPLPASPAGWLCHPVTGRQFPTAQWWRVPLLSAELGDIKAVWEAGRFGWAYDLVRGWLLTGDERYPESFFVHFERWLACSPPFRGPHWACGQETAIRALALLYAEGGFLGANAATVERRAKLRAVLGWSGERIADAIGYGLSQRNNHGLSEAVGLLLLGARLEGMHPEATRWWRRGTLLVPRLITSQFAPDGWYIQHSFNYLRLALDQCIVAQRVLLARAASLPPSAIERIQAAGALVAAVMDENTGLVPNHGANDGAFVHPITSANYRDFRPLVTAVAATFGGPMPGGVVPDPETLAWLGAEVPSSARPPGDRLIVGASGWAAARVGAFQLFFRAGHYNSRPGHLDPLTIDLRYAGREVLVDPGTFCYNAPDPWRNGLSGAAVHNGPLLNGVEPGARGPGFLWYLWPHAVITLHELRGARLVLEGEIPGWVRRRIETDGRTVVITDTALALAARELSVTWLLHPNVPTAWVETAGGAECIEAAEGAVVGWFSPAYGVRQASRVLLVRRRLKAGESVVTRVALPEGLSWALAVD